MSITCGKQSVDKFVSNYGIRMTWFAARTIMSVSIALTRTFPSTWRDERRSNCLMNSERVQLIYRTGFHLLLSPEHFWEISSVWKNPVKLSSLDTYHSSHWNRLLVGLRWCFSLCVHFDILPFVFCFFVLIISFVSVCVKLLMLIFVRYFPFFVCVSRLLVPVLYVLVILSARLGSSRTVPPPVVGPTKRSRVKPSWAKQSQGEPSEDEIRPIDLSRPPRSSLLVPIVYRRLDSLF